MKSLIRRLLGTIILLINGTSGWAGPVNPPFVTESFPSGLALTLIALPAWTGLGANVNVRIEAQGPMTVFRELNAFVQGGVDTIDTEIVSMNLIGTTTAGIPGLNVQVHAGVSGVNGAPAAFLATAPLTLQTFGQVSEKAGTPTNGVLNVFPADSFFDVFADIWVDLNGNSIAEVGEVLRNFGNPNAPGNPTNPPTNAIHMVNNSLSGLPPLLDGTDDYGTVAGDPLINFFVVNANNTQGILAARLDPSGSHTHTPNPEPASLSLLATAASVLAYRHWRRKSRVA